MINPSVDKFIIEFSNNIFDNEIAKKYDDYLFHINGPIKNIKDSLQESIQSLSIPGLQLQLLNITGISNMKNVEFGPIGSSPGNFQATTINRQYPGTTALQDVITESVINITFRNTLLNYMFIYEIFHNYFKRKRDISDFSIIITLHNAANIPLMNFVFFDCFVSSIPGLEFAFNQQFRESKTIDAGFAFNGMTSNFMIPKFNKNDLQISTIRNR